MLSLTRCLALLLTVTIVGCATVQQSVSAVRPDATGDLPEQELLAVAVAIESAVSKGDRETHIENTQQVIVETDAIQQAIRTRAARRPLIDTFLDTGFAWERADGLIHIIRSGDYKRSGTRRSRDRDAVLIMGENNDRWVLYEEILKESNFSRRDLDRLRALFTQARLDTLQAGQTYETESGEKAIK